MPSFENPFENRPTESNAAANPSSENEAFESKVTRLSDTGAPRFRVEFIGDHGEAVEVECAPPASDGEPSREEILELARQIARQVGGDSNASTPPDQPTHVGAGGGLTRPFGETEDRTHTSDGRDLGTE